MKIKRFFAVDMRQAIRQVREAQGPDAVILSSRSVDGGIEIISAIDFDQDLVAEMAAQPGDLTAERAPRKQIGMATAAGEHDEAPDPFPADPVPEPPPRPEVVWA